MKTSPISDCRIVILISGKGSNLQALINSRTPWPLNIVGVMSNRSLAYGIDRAQRANIPTQVIDHLKYATPQDFESALIKAIQSYQPKLIILAGFMRILSPIFVRQFPGKILNIHPSLLPKFKGLKTHERAINAGEIEHGVSVHFVTEELDSGPIIAQIKIPILLHDNPDSLAQRVHQAEHWLYPQVVTWYAEQRLKCTKNAVTLDGILLPTHGIQLSLPTLMSEGYEKDHN